MQECKSHLIRQTPHAFVAVAWMVLAAGCGGASNFASVRGVVEFDGAPLTDFDNAAVVFTPQAGRLATGTIASDGTFQLSTLGIGDGAVVGPAKVSVSATKDVEEGPVVDRHAPVRSVIPEKFASADTSEMVTEVEPGKENKFRIRLSSDGTASIERM